MDLGDELLHKEKSEHRHENGCVIVGRKRHFVFIFAVVECIFTTGTYMGWPSLVLVMQRGGMDIDFHLVFAFCVAGAGSGAPLFGVVLDRLGPRITNVLSCACSVTALLILAFSWKNLSSLSIALLFFLYAAGCFGVFTAVIHYSNMFPAHSRGMVSLFSAVFDLSAFIFPIYCALNISLQSVLIIHAGIISFLLTLSIILQPDSPFELYSSHVLNPTKCRNKKNRRVVSVNKRKILFDILKGSRYFWIVAFMTLNVLKIYFFLASCQEQVREQTNDSHNTKQLVEYFGYIFPLGGLSVPFVGVLLDRSGFLSGYSYTFILSVLFSIVSMIPHIVALYFSFVVIALMRSALFSCHYSYLSSRFDFSLYGTLSGVSNLGMITATVCQYILFLFYEGPFKRNLLPVHLILLTLALCSSWLLRIIYKHEKSEEVQEKELDDAMMQSRFYGIDNNQ